MYNTHIIISSGNYIKNVEYNIEKEMKSTSDDFWINSIKTIDVENATEEEKEHINKLLSPFTNVCSEEHILNLQDKIQTELDKFRVADKNSIEGLQCTYAIKRYSVELHEVAQQRGVEFSFNTLDKIQNFFGFEWEKEGITVLDFVESDTDEEGKLFFSSVSIHY